MTHFEVPTPSWPQDEFEPFRKNFVDRDPTPEFKGSCGSLLDRFTCHDRSALISYHKLRKGVCERKFKLAGRDRNAVGGNVNRVG